MVHSRSYIYSQTIAQLGKKEPEVGLDREVGKNIQGVKRKVYKRTSISNTGPK